MGDYEEQVRVGRGIDTRGVVQMSDLQHELEKASLLPDRWYLIMKEAEDGFTIAAYDTMSNEDLQEMGSVILSGVIELLHNDFDMVFEAGMESVKRQQQEVSLQTENGELVLVRDENVVRVDFGKKQ
jgi:hypothetical protein